MNFRNLGQRSVENNRQDDADGSLYQIIGDGCSGGKTLAENQRLIAEIPGDHDDLGRQFNQRQTPERDLLAFFQQRPQQQRSHQRHKALDDKRTGDIMRIACQQIGKPAADTGGKEAVPRTEHQTGKQAHALADVRIPGNSRKLHKHRRHTAQRGKHRT